MARMPEILKQVTRTVSRAELTARRKAFRDRFPPLVFGDIRIHGANRSQTKYITRTVQNKYRVPFPIPKLEA
jgi:hypothetical protein